MENLRPLHESTGKINLKIDHTCICTGIIGLES
jgi:hypothetical protein